MTIQKEKSLVFKKSEKLTDRFFNKQKLAITNKILFILIIVVGIGYMLSVNDLSIKGFVLNDLKSQIKEITKENSQIEMRIAKSESNDNINSRAQEMAMVKVDKIDFINMVSDKVARK